ncbi:MAG: hypothetical protein Hyperionvirus9_1, partial [Hyperionvirus sp.]
MNILQDAGTKDQILLELDKKIRIKYYKQGNKNKTCVYGLFDFMTEA